KPKLFPHKGLPEQREESRRRQGPPSRQLCQSRTKRLLSSLHQRILRRYRTIRTTSTGRIHPTHFLPENPGRGGSSLLLSLRYSLWQQASPSNLSHLISPPGRMGHPHHRIQGTRPAIP